MKYNYQMYREDLDKLLLKLDLEEQQLHLNGFVAQRFEMQSAPN